MKNEQKLSLTLEIDGRKYPLKVLMKDEEAYRNAAKTINNKINRYRLAYGDYSGLITQDFVTMTAIQALVENFELRTQNNTQPYEKKIGSIIDEIDQYLEEE